MIYALIPHTSSLFGLDGTAALRHRPTVMSQCKIAYGDLLVESLPTPVSIARRVIDSESHLLLQILIDPQAGEDGKTVLAPKVDFSAITFDPRLDRHVLSSFRTPYI